jgi:hypothetical protein
MTDDNGNTVSREESEPLHQVLARAREGIRTHYFPGQQFFLAACLPEGGYDPLPRPFAFVEEAVLFLVDGFPLLDLFMSEAVGYTVLIKPHPTVQ